jgi:hypothetical protein
MLLLTVHAGNEFGAPVAIDVVAYSWPSVAYVMERVRLSIGLALIGGSKVWA